MASDTMPTPGAKRSVVVEALVKAAGALPRVDAPTDTTFRRQAGSVIAEVELLLPADATTSTPRARSASTAAAPAWVQAVAPSQLPANVSNVPTLALTASMPIAGLARIQARAATTLSVKP